MLEAELHLFILLLVWMLIFRLLRLFFIFRGWRVLKVHQSSTWWFGTNTVHEISEPCTLQMGICIARIAWGLRCGWCIWGSTSNESESQFASIHNFCFHLSQLHPRMEGKMKRLNIYQENKGKRKKIYIYILMLYSYILLDWVSALYSWWASNIPWLKKKFCHLPMLETENVTRMFMQIMYTDTLMDRGGFIQK